MCTTHEGHWCIHVGAYMSHSWYPAVVHTCRFVHMRAFRCVSWHIHTCEVIHLCVWHDSFIRVTWQIYMQDTVAYTCQFVHMRAFIWVSWRIHMCDMTHPYAWNDWFIFVTWLLHVCDMTYSYAGHGGAYMSVRGQIQRLYVFRIEGPSWGYSYVWHDSFIFVTWFFCVCDIMHPHVWHDSSIRVTWLIRMCDMTHPYVWL